MALPQVEHATEAEYLALEQASREIKHEYLDGHIYAMTGASDRHNAITGSTYYALYGQTRKRPCRVYSESMRVRVSATGAYAYTDIAVVCGEPRFAEGIQPDTLLNPQVIIEVLSKSTEHYDRGEKFQHYRQLESLQEYVLIAQNNPYIEHFRRNDDDTWTLTDVTGLDDVLKLPTINCTLTLADVYEKVTFADDTSDEPESEV